MSERSERPMNSEETTGDDSDLTEPVVDWGRDPALATAVLEIEQHLSDLGWDQAARLFALVDTGDLVMREPSLAAMLGLDKAAEDGSLTAIEQEQLDGELEDVLSTISWPDSVTGCAAVVERLVLPPEADGQIPRDSAAAIEFAHDHPDRQEVRIAAGVTRAGARFCALRLRSHDDDFSVVTGPDLVPALLELLSATFDDESGQVPVGDSDG